MGGPVHHQANLVARFVLELCALAALFWWGSRAGEGPAGVALGLGAVLVAASVWGLFASPRARFSLPLAGRMGVELVFFGSAAAGLCATGYPVLGALFLGLATLNRALILTWGQDEWMRRNA